MRSTQNKGSPTARLHLQPGPINVLLDDLVTLWFGGRDAGLSTRDWTQTYTCLASTLPRNYLPALFLLSSLRQMLPILLFRCDHKPAGACWATEHVTFWVTSPHLVTHQENFPNTSPLSELCRSHKSGGWLPVVNFTCSHRKQPVFPFSPLL